MKPNKGFISVCTCDECGDLFFDGEGVVTVKHTGRSTMQFHFCSKECKDEHYKGEL